MALAHYGHMVYIEPGRFLSQKYMKDYIAHSRRNGITLAGTKNNHSPFVVTHPEMYYFLGTDISKLMRTAMFDVSMVLMHNTSPVRHYFLRYLVACALEKHCIAPPGSKPSCDNRLFSGSKKFANCHRYEMSAISIILNNWFKYQQDEYLVKDVASSQYNGKDFTSKVRVCSGNSADRNSAIDEQKQNKNDL